MRVVNTYLVYAPYTAYDNGKPLRMQYITQLCECEGGLWYYQEYSKGIWKEVQLEDAHKWIKRTKALGL